MRESFRLIVSDKFIKISILFSIIFVLLQVLLIAIFLPKLPPIVPLLNSQPWGFSRLYPANAILAIPPIIILTFIVNNILSAVFYKKNVLISRILAFNSFLFIFLALVAFIQIIFLVF
jgi:hypothetical protein